jgi:hypothetical protein
MTQIDPDPEKQRLARVYSDVTQGELLQLAEDRADLTAAAQEALDDEMHRREIDPASIIPASREEVEFREMVTIGKFRDFPEALLAKGSLDSAGIECILLDDNLVRMDWFISNAIGGIKLQVNSEDAATAMEILNQPIPEGFDVDGAEDYEQPRCPRCQSLDTTFQEIYRPIAYTSAWLGVPIPVQRKGWKCLSCGHEWQDEDRKGDPPELGETTKG